MSDTQRKSASTEGSAGETLSSFAAALGSTKGVDPIPPDQYLTYQDPRYPPEIRIMAAVLAHVIAKGHRKPWPTDRRTGAELYEMYFFKLLDMDPGGGRRAFRHLRAEGRLRKTKQHAIIVAGDFTLRVEETAPDAGENDGPRTSQKGLYRPFPAYIFNKLKELPKTTRENVVAEVSAIQERHQRVRADFVEADRCIEDSEYDSALAQVGVKVIRENHNPPKGKEAEVQARKERVESLLPMVKRYVQTFFEKVCTDSKSGFVQTIPPILYSEQYRERLASEPQAAPEPQITKPPAEGDAWEPPVELAAHMSAISHDLRKSLGKPNAGTLKNFWRAAIQRSPGASLQDVANAIASTVRKNEGLETWGGIFTEFRGTQASTQPPPPAKAAPPAKRPPPPVDPEGQEFAAGLVDMLAGKTRGAS
jgi:hypothetical protein